MKKVTIDGVIYGVRDTEVVVCGPAKGMLTINIHIKHEIQGKPVIEIRKRAFYGLPIETVVVPNTINRIMDEAFANCKNLKKVTGYAVDTSGYLITQGLNRIHPWVFISDYAFAWCENLALVALPKGARWVYISAFEDCKNLRDINMQLGQIRKHAFKGCSSLREISIDNGGHISNQSIEDSAIRKITVADNFSYTTLIEAYMKKTPVKIRCAASSNMAALAYMGFDVEFI